MQKEEIPILIICVSCIAENYKQGSDTSASNLMQKTRTVLAVEKHAAKDHFTAAEKVCSPIHSTEDMTMPQKAV